jgi:hypothetical protein
MLRWDPSKFSSVTLGDGPLERSSTLGIMVNSRLSFQEHINDQMEKAAKLAKVMYRLGNINGGMYPSSLRALITGALRPIFTWGSEVWNGRGHKYNIQTFHHLEYQALRNFTRGYHGSSHEKLGFIANIEPTQAILAHISIRWAAKACRTRTLASGTS